MALTDGENGNGFYMPVAPAYNGGFGNGNNGFGGDWAWIILLLLLGWGNNGFGGGYGGNGEFPWLLNGQNGINENVNDGFRDQMLNTTVNGIQQGVNNLSTQLCNCCGDMQMALATGFANAETAANARQMADMNQNFGLQTAMMQGFNGVGTQFADCCCENRLGLADLKYTVATENCADRQALNEGVRDIIASQTAGTQRILDQLCADKIDAKNDEIAQLRQQLNMATLHESQIAQNAFISQGFANEVDQLYNRLNNCPVPSTPVYGKTPIFTCDNNSCGCGCGANL